MYVTETQAYQQKTEKFFVGKEKEFGRIDSRIVVFTIKNIDIIILFACLVGWLNYSPVEIKKKIRLHNL